MRTELALGSQLGVSLLDLLLTVDRGDLRIT